MAVPPALCLLGAIAPAWCSSAAGCVLLGSVLGLLVRRTSAGAVFPWPLREMRKATHELALFNAEIYDGSFI